MKGYFTQFRLVPSLSPLAFRWITVAYYEEFGCVFGWFRRVIRRDLSIPTDDVMGAAIDLDILHDAFHDVLVWRPLIRLGPSAHFTVRGPVFAVYFSIVRTLDIFRFVVTSRVRVGGPEGLFG